MENHSEKTEFKSFFPKIFASKLDAYAKGESSAYLHGKTTQSKTDANAPNFFQKWILNVIGTDESKSQNSSKNFFKRAFGMFKSSKNANKTHEKSGIDISRMFDEIELRPDIMNEVDGESEYGLAKADVKNLDERMININIAAAELLLNDTKTDLNDYAKKLLNNSMPGSYDKLIKKLKSNDPSLSEEQKIAEARQELAYAVVKAVRACYCQKLQDINNAKHARVGLDMEMKSLSNPKLARAQLEKKLTLIKLSDVEPPRYFIYGNTTGSGWALNEIPQEKLGSFDFEDGKVLPYSHNNNLLYSFIEDSKFHTLSQENKDENAKRKVEHTNFYNDVISPIQTLNARPITTESFDIKVIERKTTQQLYAEVQLQTFLARNAKELLEMYKGTLNNAEKIAVIDAAIANLQKRIYEDEVIREFMSMNHNADSKMEDFLAIQIDNNTTDLILEAANTVINIMDEKLATFSLLVENDVVLTSLVEEERSRLSITKRAIADTGEAYKIDVHLNSPINLIVQMHNELNNLNELLKYTEEYIKDQDIQIALQELIVKTNREITTLVSRLQNKDVTEDDIDAAKKLLSSPVVDVAIDYGKACENNDNEQKELLITKLQTLDKGIMDLNLLKLSRYLEEQGLESYQNTIKEISSCRTKCLDCTVEDMHDKVKNDLIFVTAEKLNRYNRLPESANTERMRLAKTIKQDLKLIEAWYDNRNSTYSARQNLNTLAEYVENSEAGLNKTKLKELIVSAQDSINDDNLHDSKIANKLNNNIIKLANQYAAIVNSKDEAAKLVDLNSKLKSLTIPPTLSFQNFKSLFRSESSKGALENKNNDNEARDTFQPK